jgi:hypothetical protein
LDAGAAPHFERAEPLGAEAAERAEDAGAVGLWGTWTLTLIVLALIGIAVGDELAIAHPGDEATVGFSVFAFGGPALFLLAQLLFHQMLGRVPRSRPLGLAAARAPRRGHGPAHPHRRDRGIDRGARRGGDQRHGPGRPSGTKQVGLAARRVLKFGMSGFRWVSADLTGQSWASPG